MDDKFYEGQRVYMTGLVPVADLPAEGLKGTIARRYTFGNTWRVRVDYDPTGYYADELGGRFSNLWFYEEQIHPEIEVPVFVSPEDALRWFDLDE